MAGNDSGTSNLPGIPASIDGLINENAVRDLVIYGIWQGMQYSEMRYETKLETLAKRFFLSTNRLSEIIRKYTNLEKDMRKNLTTSHSGR